jgi:TRAP-type C4-dicarboxylate transport system permease small subunit
MLVTLKVIILDLLNIMNIMDIIIIITIYLLNTSFSWKKQYLYI